MGLLLAVLGSTPCARWWSDAQEGLLFLVYKWEIEAWRGSDFSHYIGVRESTAQRENEFIAPEL